MKLKPSYYVVATIAVLVCASAGVYFKRSSNEVTFTGTVTETCGLPGDGAKSVRVDGKLVWISPSPDFTIAAQPPQWGSLNFDCGNSLGYKVKVYAQHEPTNHSEFTIGGSTNYYVNKL